MPELIKDTKLKILEELADVVENLVYEAVGLEECFNPSEYVIPATTLQQLTYKLEELAKHESGENEL